MQLQTNEKQVILTFESKQEYRDWLIAQRQLSWQEYNALIFRGNSCSEKNNRCCRCPYLKTCRKLDDKMLNRAIKTEPLGLAKSVKEAKERR